MADPRQTLHDLIRRFGTSLAEDSLRCKGMLRDLCGSSKREIAGLVAAIEEKVTTELLKPHPIPVSLRANMIIRLETHRGLAPDLAMWTVDTWGLVLGVWTQAELDQFPSIAPPPSSTPPVASRSGSSPVIDLPVVEVEPPQLDINQDLPLTASDRQTGVKKAIVLDNGKRLEVNLPGGLTVGQKLRLQGQGKRDPVTGSVGDVYLVVKEQRSSPPNTSVSSPSSVVSGLRSESYTFETVTGTDAAGRNGQRRSITITRWIEDLGNGVLLYLVKIPAGSFMMGSPGNEVRRLNNEGPQHRVTFPQDFWMGQFAVTQAQYQAITGENLSNFRGAQNPVETVSWDDATAFCERLKNATGRAYCLPTEAEWEYACRAGTTTAFHFGESITPDMVNYNGNCPYPNAAKGTYRQTTTPVGSFPGNQWGLYDMHGNVWEWCQDEWHDSYTEKPESLKQNGSIAWVVISSSSNKARCLRGGSWSYVAGFSRSAVRGRDFRVNAGSGRGFRVILPAK